MKTKKLAMHDGTMQWCCSVGIAVQYINTDARCCQQHLHWFLVSEASGYMQWSVPISSCMIHINHITTGNLHTIVNH